MNDKIQERVDQQRGCGFRKEGGLYLIAGGLSSPCGRLPVPLERCPCCGEGISFCRGWTWINLAKLTESTPCRLPAKKCGGCPLNESIERAGLLWIGERYYSMDSFTEEAARLGVSRRIKALPNDFKVGETWVALAHISAVSKDCPECGAAPGSARPFILQSKDCETCGGEQYHAPGIFHLFKPTAIEYVVTGTETEDEIDALIKRGITPVRVTRKESA